MTTALVVYESLFGNTRTIAEAIGDGLADHLNAQVLSVTASPVILPRLDLLVVGGPTHQLSMTRLSTRTHAAATYPEAPAAEPVGLREWLDYLGDTGGLAAAAFDTRLLRPWVLRVVGHAGRSAERRLRQHGCRIIDPAQAYAVDSATGPLVSGELDRARAWGERLAGILLSEAPCDRQVA